MSIYILTLFFITGLVWPEAPLKRIIVIHKHNVEAEVSRAGEYQTKVVLRQRGAVIATNTYWVGDVSTTDILQYTDQVIDLRSKHLEAL